MGKIRNNQVTKGFSGKYGEDIVFRQVDNQTIFAAAGEITAPATESQLAVRNRFSEAANFASAAINHPQASQDYKLMATAQGLKSSYVAAVTDYLTVPEIGSVFTNGYTGAVGDVISMTSKLPYKFTGISVSILKADGTVVEAGEAAPNELKWRYTSTVANPQVQGCKLVLKSRDRQGKEQTLEKVLA